MPVCAVCDSEEFELLDGHYYCTECQTQTQDIRDEQTEEGVAHGQLMQQSTSKKDKKEVVVDHGRPWLTCEAFQIILVEQAECLMRMGASPQLKEVLHQLWARFLHQTGQAYCKEPWTDPESSCFGRDIWPGNMKKPVAAHVKKTLNVMKLGKLKNKDIERQQEREDLEMTVGKEDFYEGDNPLEEVEAEEEAEKEELAPVIDYLEITPIERCRNVRYMSIRRTLCLLYLSCLYTESPVLASDILRWAEEGVLPFRNCLNLLPDNMKLSQVDVKSFLNVQVLQSKSSLLMETASLAVFLGQTNFPHPSIRTVASILLTRLHLPDELHGCVQTLISRRAMSLLEPVKYILPYETLAMAYIIVTLKLLLGLDDNTERLYSSYARKIAKNIKTNQKLFVWDEWVHYTEMRNAKKAASKRPATALDALRCHDISACLEHDDTLSLQQRRLTSGSLDTTNVVYTAYGKRKRNLHYEMEKKDVMQECLKRWLDHDQRKQTEETKTTPPKKRKVEEKSIDELLGDTPTKCSDSKQNQTGFTDTTIGYIRGGAEFLKHKGNFGLANVTLTQLFQDVSPGKPRSGEARDDENNNTDDTGGEEEEFESHVDEPRARKRRRSSGLALETQRKRLRKNPKTPLKDLYKNMPDSEEDTSLLCEDEVDEELRDLSEKISARKNNYIMYDRHSTQFHISYTWLLDVCSSHVRTTPLELHNMVYGLETVLMRRAADAKATAIISSQHIVWKFFTKYHAYVRNMPSSTAVRKRKHPEEEEKWSEELEKMEFKKILYKLVE